MALFELTELASFVQSDLDTATAQLCHDQALAYLEAEVGVSLSQHEDVTIGYTPRWDDTIIDLPVPTTTVSTVAVDGATLAATDYTVLDHRIFRSVGWGGSRWVADRFAYQPQDEYVSVDVTLTYGYATPPAEFKTYGLILASQAYQLMPSLNRQSVRIDDYAETFATGGPLVAVGMGLPGEVLGKLKARYGRRNAQVVESR